MFINFLTYLKLYVYFRKLSFNINTYYTIMERKLLEQTITNNETVWRKSHLTKLKSRATAFMAFAILLFFSNSALAQTTYLTNYAAGISDQILTHEDVILNANSNKESLSQLLLGIIKRI